MYKLQETFHWLKKQLMASILLHLGRLEAAEARLVPVVPPSNFRTWFWLYHKEKLSHGCICYVHRGCDDLLRNAVSDCFPECPPAVAYPLFWFGLEDKSYHPVVDELQDG